MATTDDERRRWIECGLANLAGTWEHVARGMGGRWTEWDGGRASDLGSTCPFLNNVALPRPLDDEAGATTAAHVERFFAERPGGTWLLWSGYPAPYLADHGYAAWGEPPLMVRPPGGEQPPFPPELSLVEATDAATLGDFERVLVDGYPAPWLQPYQPRCAFDERILGGPLRAWVGYVDGEPVSVSAAYTDDAVNGVYMVATMPQARGKGYGSAVTWAATVAKPELPAILQSSELGFPTYNRLGYELISHVQLWAHDRDAL